jgi:predicted ATPase
VYALEKLADSGDFDAVARRHAELFGEKRRDADRAVDNGQQIGDVRAAQPRGLRPILAGLGEKTIDMRGPAPYCAT